MKAFVSDLDQTLIFSTKWLALTEAETLLVECYEGKPITYMAKRSLEILESISKECTFVPVTTRVKHQYDRIDFRNIKINHAIVANGGMILENGQIDTVWDDYIRRCLKDVGHYREIFCIMEKVACNFSVSKLRKDDEFLVYLVDDRADVHFELMTTERAELNKLGWNTFLVGRKIYCLPNFITKEAAVSYLAKEKGIEPIVAAGDSILDIGMSKVAKKMLVPAHGSTNYPKFTDIVGIDGSIEMLNLVKTLM